MSDVTPVRRLIRRVTTRLRAQRAIEAVGTMLILTGAWMILAVFLVKVRHLGPEHFSLILGLALFFPLTALLVSILRPIRPMMAAQIVDRRLGLKDQFGSAYDFSTREKGEIGPYAKVQMEDAASRAASVRIGQAVPIRLPRKLLVFLAQVVAVVILVLLPEFPEPARAQAAAPPPEAQGMAVEFDELDGFNEFLRDVHQDAVDEELDEVAQAAKEFNKLLQDLADQRLQYRDALERIAAIEQKLADQRWEPDPEAERFLKQIGQDLQKSKLTKDAGEALRENELRKARDEVRKTAEQVKREPPDKQRMNELRRALEKAAKRQPPNYDEQLKRLKQERRRLKQKNQQNKQSERNKRRLKKNKRELETLQRNLDRQRERQRQLERLQRDLEQLSASLNLNASDEMQQMLEQLAEDINRMAREQSSEQQMQQLRERLEELRRLLQQLQRGGKGFKVRLGRFNKGARCGCKGGGKGGGNGKTITLMPGGRGGKGGLVLLKKKGGQGGKQGQGQDKGGNKGGGIGSSHDPNNQGDPTQMKAKHTDVEVSLQHGEGPSRSQVIETAAEDGFASPHYTKIHETYERHAESQLEKQDVPPGYRRYIRLYFERIRPR